MTKISSSPERGSFQVDCYLKSRKNENKEPDVAYLEQLKTLREHEIEREQDSEWQKDNLEYDLRTTDWILEKVRTDPIYAQNLYAAMCNNDFQKLEVVPILKDQRWSCSWRHAGGIIAHMRKEGDYIDWYCSGYSDESGIVEESVITDKVRADLHQLGWTIIEYTGK